MKTLQTYNLNVVHTYKIINVFATCFDSWMFNIGSEEGTLQVTMNMMIRV